MSANRSSAFRRALPPQLVQRLNDLAARPDSWWYRVVHDPNAYVAIRGDYLNVYVYGGSILKVAWDGDVLCSIHHKYLTVPDNDSRYVSLDRDSPDSVAVIKSTEVFARNYDRIKRQIELYAGRERAGIGRLAARQDWVIDVEIAFSSQAQNRAEEDDRGADRVDFVGLHPGSGQLVFCEAKIYDNPELRGGRAAPPVVTQVERYRGVLQHPAKIPEIVAAYEEVRSLYSRLNGGFFERRRPSICRPARLAVDPEPRLVIFDYDRTHQKHLIPKMKEDLARQCGLDPRSVLAKGDVGGLHSNQVFWRQLS